MSGGKQGMLHTELSGRSRDMFWKGFRLPGTSAPSARGHVTWRTGKGGRAKACSHVGAVVGAVIARFSATLVLQRLGSLPSPPSPAPSFPARIVPRVVRLSGSPSFYSMI